MTYANHGSDHGHGRTGANYVMFSLDTPKSNRDHNMLILIALAAEDWDTK